MLHKFLTTRFPQGERRDMALLFCVIYLTTVAALYFNSWATPAVSAPVPAPEAHHAVPSCGALR